MRVAVVGCRDYFDYARIAADLDRCRGEWGDFTVVTGDAKGVDAAAVRWAKERGLPWVAYEADWELYGLAAGPRRNEVLVADSDVVIAFWDGRSRGTASSISIAKNAGKKVFIRSI
jgi:predicted Rossmann fold nucleotide-binding protein DprA/Smf involved in DNA uptake